MTENQLEPAISAKDWADPSVVEYVERGEGYVRLDAGFVDLVWMIAACNHALPDDSPYKITRLHAAAARSAATSDQERYGLTEYNRTLSALADLLSSLLPPPPAV